MTRGLVRTLLAATLFSLAAVYAQSPAPTALDSAARSAVVHAAAKQLRDGYVLPELGEQTARAIEAALAAGSYDALNEPAAFAERVTADLNTVAHDKHLRIFPPGGLAPPPTATPPRSEAGVIRADLLAGNIGYIEVVSFPPLGVFRAPLDRAMARLVGTKALVIDVRRHGGGMPDALDYLVSYFLPQGAAPVAIGHAVWRNRGTNTFRTQDFWSSPTPFSYAGKPIYVLTSSQTVSGGEALAYDMRALRLCKIVGETTAGAAHPGDVVPLEAGFAMFLPVGRGRDGDWEGVGVKPDITVPAADALKVALERLGQKPSAADIDALSSARLFTPRTTAQPGTDAAVRRLIEELERGEPNYNLLEDGTAQLVRGQLGILHDLYTRLGSIQAVTFAEVDPAGADVYDVRLANGSVRVALGLTPEGKTAIRDARVTTPPPPK